ncbi:MAG: response regulator transcription factor [Actinomycetota bacterium]|nr:response regulator transcription factor [Actinomycetota bacterium]
MPESHEKVRILLADEQSLFREAVRIVLQEQPDLEVVAEARDGVQAIAEAERTHPDVALLEAHLPNCDGLKATGAILQRVPRCKVVILTGEEDEAVLIDALEAGASGYLSKSAPLAELIEATRQIAQGHTLVPQRMLGPLLDRLLKRRKTEDESMRRLDRLTRREKEVLLLLSKGSDNDSIAQELVISPQTARTHVQNVLSKLGVHSRLEAAAFARRSGAMEVLVRTGS